MQSLLTPISPALSFQCLASFPAAPSAFAGKRRSVGRAIIFPTHGVIPEWCLCSPVLLIPHCGLSNVWQEGSECLASDGDGSGKD